MKKGKNNHFTVIILTGFVIVIALILTITYIRSTLTESGNAYADWKTYTNTKYNYSFKYPSGVTLFDTSVRRQSKSKE